VLRFLVPKVGGALLTLLLAITLAFVLGRAAGDPVQQLLGGMGTEEQVAALRTELGFDRPLVVQYVDYLTDLARGDLGESVRYSQSNWDLIRSRLPASLQLAGAAVVIGTLLGIPLGIVAALRENSLWDRISVTLALVGQSLPLFWLGLMLVLFFSIRLGWLPSGQSGTWRHLVLPAVTLATFPLARIARLTRSSMSEVLENNYLAAARARGLGEWRVIFGHALRNASLPVLTLIGLQAGALLSSAVTVEFVFAWPGLGTLATQAVQFRDFGLVQAIVVVGAVTFVAINLLVDVIYGIIDPRIRDSVSA